MADRLKGERAGAGRVVADRGQAALRDRELEAHLPALGDDLRGRPRLRDGRLALAGNDCRRRGRRPAERRQGDGHEEDRGEDDEEGDQTRPARNARLPAFDPPPPGGA